MENISEQNATFYSLMNININLLLLPRILKVIEDMVDDSTSLIIDYRSIHNPRRPTTKGIELKKNKINYK